MRCDLPAPIRILGRLGTLTADTQGVVILTLAKSERATLVSGNNALALALAPLPVAHPQPTWGLL